MRFKHLARTCHAVLDVDIEPVENLEVADV